MDRHVPAFRRGIRRCLKRCRVLREGTLNPLQTELQGAFDQISVELEALKAAQAAAKKAGSTSGASPATSGGGGSAVATPAKANGGAPLAVTPPPPAAGRGLDANLSPKSPMSPPSARAKQNTSNRIGKAVPRTDSSGAEVASPSSGASPSGATSTEGGSKGWAAASAAAGAATASSSSSGASSGAPTSPTMADVVVDTMAASGLKPKASFRGRFNTQDIRLMALKPSEVAQLEQEYANPQDPPPGEDIIAEAIPSASSSSASSESRPERMVPDMAKFGNKWKQSAENSNKDTAPGTAAAANSTAAAASSGAAATTAANGPQGATSSQVPSAPTAGAGGAPPTGRDATVAVINRWTRKLWEVGKRLERQFEDYLSSQEAYEEQLLEATDTFHDAQQALLALPGVDDAVAAAAAAAPGNSAESSSSVGSPGDAESNNNSGSTANAIDAATSEAAASLAEAAAATTSLMRNEPAPTLVTGFIDTGSTNCFTGAYELKIRLEHIGERLRLLLDTVDVLGDGTDDEDELAAADSSGAPPSTTA